MSAIPGMEMAEEVAMRFEVPVNAEGSGYSMTVCTGAVQGSVVKKKVYGVYGGTVNAGDGVLEGH